MLYWLHRAKFRSSAQRFRGEIEIWRNARHKNVLPFFGHYVDDNSAMYMVSPWCFSVKLMLQLFDEKLRFVMRFS